MNETKYFVSYNGAEIYDSNIEADEKKVEELKENNISLEEFNNFSEAKSSLVQYWTNLEKETRRILKQVKAL